MEHLFDKLEQYGNSDYYPYHMPGHKRKAVGSLPAEMYRTDITEIDGFDNLHAPEEILFTLQQKAAKMYGAEESFYLVNGSTCGILSAISAAVAMGGRLMMTRNCHKSAYHAAYLRQLKLDYLYPDMIPGFDILEAITPEAVQAALQKGPVPAAVLVVSPTYEGRIADIKSIAKIVHSYDIPLIVDEAHGAHLGLADVVCENSIRLGADIVIHSVHKTLPGLTQTALLHVQGSRIDREKLKRFLRIYQTSSPSYLLMAGIDNALRFVEEQGAEAFCEMQKQFSEMVKQLEKCKVLQVLPYVKEKQDLGKLIISVKNAGISGKELYRILLEKYHLQLEMATETYVLAMFTVGDNIADADCMNSESDLRVGYTRMLAALLEIDADLQSNGVVRTAGIKPADDILAAESENQKYITGTASTLKGKGSSFDAKPLAESWDAVCEEVLLDNSVGRYAGEFVNLYPPGVPLLVPGEYIFDEIVTKIEAWFAQGLNVQGVVERDGRYFVKIIK